MYDKLKYIGATIEHKKLDFALLLPQDMRSEFIDNSFVGGGSIYTMYNEGKFNDIDIFVKSKDLLNRIEKFISENISDYKVLPLKKIATGKFCGERVVITNNAISIGIHQLIKKDYGEPIDVVGRFDFKHNMFWVEDGEVKTLSHTDYLKSKKLMFNKDRARDIVGTLVRVPKFIDRGFTVSYTEMSQMLLKLYENGFQEDEIERLKNLDRFNSNS